jgi:hypothetical protein
MTAQKIHDTVNEFRDNGQKKVGVYLAPLSTFMRFNATDKIKIDWIIVLKK